MKVKIFPIPDHVEDLKLSRFGRIFAVKQAGRDIIDKAEIKIESRLKETLD